MPTRCDDQLTIDDVSVSGTATGLLGDLVQKHSGDLLVHVRVRGLEIDRRGQVSGAGPVQERRGDALIHVGPRLLGSGPAGR